jgi:hypothetical protein
MNREEQISAKALELAALILGPVTDARKNALREEADKRPGDTTKAKEAFGRYLPMAELVTAYLVSPSGDRS